MFSPSSPLTGSDGLFVSIIAIIAAAITAAAAHRTAIITLVFMLPVFFLFCSEYFMNCVESSGTVSS